MAIIGPFGFRNGINTRATSTTLGKDQLSYAQDVYLVGGDLVKRPGSRTLNTSAISGNPTITGISDWQTNAGQRYQVVTAGTKIYQTADLGTSLTDITGAVSITSGNVSTFASLNNRIVRCGGSDAPIVWTGSGNAAALGGSPPSGSICYTVNNFMFIAGISSTPSRFYWSNVSDPTTWTSTNYADFRKDDGDKITALAGINQFLVIFKRGCIGQFDTTSTIVSGNATIGPLYTTIPGIGCAGALAVDALPDGKLAFFGSNAHMYLYDGSTALDISDPDTPQSNIQNQLDTLVNLQNAVVRYYPTRQQIWLSACQSGSSTNNVIYVYDVLSRCWSGIYNNINANVMAVCIDTRSTINHAKVLLTGNYGGRVYEQDYGNQNPEATNNVIDGYGTTSIQLSGEGSQFIPRSVIVQAEYEGAWSIEMNYGYNDFAAVSKSNLLSVGLSTTSGLGSFVLDVNTLAGDSPIRHVSLVNANNICSSMQIQFRNRLADQPFVVHPFYVSDEVVL